MEYFFAMAVLYHKWAGFGLLTVIAVKQELRASVTGADLPRITEVNVANLLDRLTTMSK